MIQSEKKQKRIISIDREDTFNHYQKFISKNQSKKKSVIVELKGEESERGEGPYQDRKLSVRLNQTQLPHIYTQKDNRNQSGVQTQQYSQMTSQEDSLQTIQPNVASFEFIQKLMKK